MACFESWAWFKDVGHQLEVSDYQRLLSIPGVGPLTATALLAFVGDARRFPTGRHFASYIGLTPSEHSRSLTRHLGGISKRGESYLRMLLIHGARSVLFASRRRNEPERPRAWAMAIGKRSGFKKAAVALANTLARIIWAVCRQPEAASVTRPKAA